MRTACLLAGLFLGGCGKGEGHREDRHEKQVGETKLELQVTIGDTQATWGPTEFAKVPKLSGKANDGEARDVWNLQDLVAKNVGPGARVISVTGGGKTVTVDEQAWTDPAHVPILHATKRGALKYRYATTEGEWGDTVVKDVTGIAVAK